METRAEANTIHSQGCFEDGRTAARPVAGGWGGGWGAGSRSPWPSLADPDPETHLGVGGMGGEEREPLESVTKETPLAGAATRASNPENF